MRHPLGRDFGGIADEAFGQREGERRDAIDDDKGIADDGGLYGCRPAGHDTGPGVMERFAGIVYQNDRSVLSS